MEGPPDKYDLKPTAGSPDLNARTIEEATPLFRELGLTNAQAQKLVDFYQKFIVADNAKLAEKMVNDRLAADRSAAEKDPELAGKLDSIKVTIGRAFDALESPKLVEEFKEAMNFTGVGNNPAFIKVFNRMASKFVEGQPATGSGPSPFGQGKPAQRPSIAEAMWPNLVRQ